MPSRCWVRKAKRQASSSTTGGTSPGMAGSPFLPAGPAGGYRARCWVQCGPLKWPSSGHFSGHTGQMRADRLVAALLVLQSRGQVTAEELALELEVSPRTARRDLEGLAMAGIPVYSQPGRGGGWRLLGGSRTDLSGLTAAEAPRSSWSQDPGPPRRK